MDSLVEAVRQLRGKPLGLAPARRPDTALVQGAGGMLAAGSVMVLSSAA